MNDTGNFAPSARRMHCDNRLQRNLVIEAETRIPRFAAETSRPANRVSGRRVIQFAARQIKMHEDDRAVTGCDSIQLMIVNEHAKPLKRTFPRGAWERGYSVIRCDCRVLASRESGDRLLV